MREDSSSEGGILIEKITNGIGLACCAAPDWGGNWEVCPDSGQASFGEHVALCSLNRRLAAYGPKTSKGFV